MGSNVNLNAGPIFYVFMQHLNDEVCSDDIGVRQFLPSFFVIAKPVNSSTENVIKAYSKLQKRSSWIVNTDVPDVLYLPLN